MSRSGRNLQRLECLARTIGVTAVCPVEPVIRPNVVPPTDEDRLKVEDALARTRLERFQARKHHLRSKPSSSPFDASEATEALQTQVENGCTPGKALELLKRGADVNFVACESKGIWEKIRGHEPEAVRSTLFIRAVEQQNVGLVNVLVNKADQVNIDQGLDIAIRSKHLVMVRILISMGADPNRCQLQFCSAVEEQDCDTVAAHSSGKRPIKSTTATQCLYEAVRLSNQVITRTLVYLKADANTDDASALAVAVRAMDLTLVVSLCMAEFHPQSTHLGNNVNYICKDLDTRSIPENVLLLIEILLAAGADGNGISQALAVATQRSQLSLIRLLVNYTDFDAEHTPAALQSAIAAGDVESLSSLLALGSSTELIDSLMPDVLSTRPAVCCEKRMEMMKTLIELRPSAHIVAEALQDATEHQEIDLVRYLVDSGAPVDSNSGYAVLLAIKLRSPELLSIMLRAGPLQQTLQTALKETEGMPSVTRIKFVQALVNAGVTGEEPDNSLLLAVMDHDESSESLHLLETLVQSGADVNVKQGKCLSLATGNQHIAAVAILLKGSPNRMTLAKSFDSVMLITDLDVRFTLLQMLLIAGAQGPNVDQALCDVIDGTLEGARLSKLILRSGKPDINLSHGEAVRRTVLHKDLDLLSTLMISGPAICSLNTALQQAVYLQEREIRPEVCSVLLRAGATGTTLGQALKTIIGSDSKDLELIKLLLSFKASIDFDAGWVIRTAMSQANDELHSILLKTLARPETLVFALGHLCNVHTDRNQVFRTTTVLLNAGTVVSPDSLGALLHHVFDNSVDVRTLKLLLERGASVNLQPHEAFKKAIDLKNKTVLSLLLDARPSEASLRKVFEHVWMTQYEAGLEMMRIIIQNDTHRRAIELDEHLIRAIYMTPCSYPVTEMLLAAEASVEYSDSLVLHCVAKRLDCGLLAFFLPHVKTRNSVTAVLKRLMQNPAVWKAKAGLPTVQLLLEHGANGEVLDHSLLLATESYGLADNASGILDCLIKHEASADYNKGQVLEVAARRGVVPLVARLLDTNPSRSTVRNAFSYIFLSSADEQATLRLMDIFCAQSMDVTDVNTGRKELEPLLFLCMRKWPQSTTVLEALMKAGSSPDQTIQCITGEGDGSERTPALVWATCQIMPKISDSVIRLLIDSAGMFQHSASMNCRIANNS